MTATAELFPTLTVVRISKQCRECGRQWQGNYFSEWLPKARRAAADGTNEGYVLAECDACIDVWSRKRERALLLRDMTALTNHLRTAKAQHSRRLTNQQIDLLVKIRRTYTPGESGYQRTTDAIAKLHVLVAGLDAKTGESLPF